MAKELGISYVDSGALYRTVTLQLLRTRTHLGDDEGIRKVLAEAEIDMEFTKDGAVVFLNGEDVTGEIRSAEVTANVSTVSEHPEIRDLVTTKLRRIAENSSIVLEGRDIGTVVFPDADLKAFMDASIEARASRRFAELQSAGVRAELNEIKTEIVARDRKDSERKIAPLRRANDAFYLDNTNLSIEQGVDFIVQEARKLLLDKPN